MTSEVIREKKLARIDAVHRCGKGNSALIVVDMQHGFLDPGASLELGKARALIPNIQLLVACCRSLGIPVIFTEFVYSPTIPCFRGDPFGIEHLPAEPNESVGLGYPSDNCLIGERMGEGSEAAATVHALKPRPDELVVQGHTYDKFYGTHLDLAMRSQGIDRMIMTGITTDVCVNATLIAGSTRNYRVTAVTDTMAAVHDHHHEACLEIWENKFARLMSTENMLEELHANAG